MNFAICLLTLTNDLVHVNIFHAWQGSSVEEQETHKLLVAGSTPALATSSIKACHQWQAFGFKECTRLQNRGSILDTKVS